MSLRSANMFGATAGSPFLVAAVLGIAALAGMITAFAGGTAGYRAIYFVAVFAVIVLGGIVALTRDEPLRFAFLALILGFPIANALVPPGRFGITVFDAVMIALTLALIAKKLLASPTTPVPPFFPTKTLLVTWLRIYFSIPFIITPIPRQATRSGSGCRC